MTPSEMRERILGDHAELRRSIADLGELSREALCRGTADREELRTAGEQLLLDLEQHMQREEEHLLPVLRTLDAWGEERALHVETDHRGQRKQMRIYLAALQQRDSTSSQLATLLLDLTSWLERDMVEEEETTLHPDVLRDDVVGIEVETG